ncbi:tol-pal system-associated acyl-CoA thioesterase [Paraferrimonas sp. SM1919]|uniref:tol-pal system-associated acyl-CoA thioesterase n=1 Tax=Paraferrimonas sp. SM1919 TaxID=2662263 RepID=UPI0013CFE307|nr:tol-pal system-associated acyl-CoA thioesterase [Paraferrimonas sp. SM1919]
MQFSWPITIYYEDTDAGGIVYHANYLKFFERARSEWLTHLGINQSKLLAAKLGFVVTKAELDFVKGAQLEQKLKVVTKLEKAARASLLFVQELQDDTGALYCQGKIKVACIDMESMRPCAIPKEILKEFTCGS